MADKIQLRRDTAANWTTANTVLSQGEQGYETDTGKMKVGDGTTAWSSLSYFGGSTLSDLDVTATSTELNYVDGVTSAIQTQLDAKAETLTDLGITDGTNGQVLTTDGSGTFTFATASGGGFEKSYRYTGTLSTNTGTLRLYLHKAATLSEIDLFVNTAPSGSAINLDINKNGTSVATPSISADSTSNTGISASVSFAEGDYITVDIDQVGSSTAGSDLYAVLTFT